MFEKGKFVVHARRMRFESDEKNPKYLHACKLSTIIIEFNYNHAYILYVNHLEYWDKSVLLNVEHLPLEICN